jgi:hypothetical protein
MLGREALVAARIAQRRRTSWLKRERANALGKSLRACILMAVLFITAAAFAPKEFAADNSSTTPVVIELFTSEGCSSCPPADELLERMDSLQPIPGAQLIVLSEHVDYWNHDGWTDPFSSASITERQTEYVRELGLKSPFTPQFLVDGTKELQAQDPQNTLQILTQAAAAPKIPLRLDTIDVATGNPVNIQGHAAADSNSLKHKADVFVAIALDHAESQVSRGENSGRHLTHVAVVTDIAKIGKLEPGKPFAQDFHLKLKLPAADSNSIRVVAFAQESGPGKILAAALAKASRN